MKLKKPGEKPLLLLLLKRCTLFCSLMFALCFFLYLLGSTQQFLDSTQLKLLTALSWLGIISSITAFYGFVYDVYLATVKKTRSFLWGALGYALIAAVSLGCSVFVYLILSAVAGTSR